MPVRLEGQRVEARCRQGVTVGRCAGRHRSGEAPLVRTMKIDEEVQIDLQRRLRRIEGQVRGIQKMLEEDRECRDVVTQIAAVTKAMEQVGFKMLASGLVSCLQDPDRAAAEGYPVEEVERLFLKLT